MEQNISRICHKIYLPNDTSEVSLCPTPPEGLASRAPGLQRPAKPLRMVVTHREPKEAD